MSSPGGKPSANLASDTSEMRQAEVVLRSSESGIAMVSSNSTPGAHRPLIFCVGVNHRTANTELRESLHVQSEQLQAILPFAKSNHQVHELAALSTCNRFELIGVTGVDEMPETALIEIFSWIQSTTHSEFFRLEDVKPHLYLYTGSEAIRHILRVTSSLDSLVLGETQITGQFKDAIETARQSETIGPILHRLAQDALGTAKKIRSKTDIGKKPVSISHAAVDLAQRLYGSIANHAVLIVGAGEMATLAAKHVLNYKPKRLIIANRSAEKAEALVAQLGFGEAADLSHLGQWLKECDIVIASTSSQKPIITYSMVTEALAARKGKALFMVDIAIPRNIEAACGKPDDAFLFDIDDLRKVVDSNQEERRAAADQAEVFITEGSKAFDQWLSSLSIKPTLGALRQYLADIVQKESSKTFSRESLKALTEAQRDAIEGLLEAVVNRVSGDVSSRIMTPAPGHYSDQLADSLQALFPLKLQRETPEK